jgi:hypothetical protein
MTTAHTANLTLVRAAKPRRTFFDRFMAHLETATTETYTLSKTTVWLVPIVLTLAGLVFTLLANYGAFIRSDETKSGDIRMLVEKVGSLNTKFDAFQSDSKSEAKENKLELKEDIQALQNKISQLEQRVVTSEAKINSLDRRGG